MDANKKATLILGINREGHIVQFNRECEQITGFERDEVLQKKLWDALIPISFQDRMKELFDSLVQSTATSEIILPLKTFDGKEIIISWTCTPSKDELGSVKDICFIGTIDAPQEYQRYTIPLSPIKKQENIIKENLIEIEPLKPQISPKDKSENIQISPASSEETMSSLKQNENVVVTHAKRHTIVEKRLAPELKKPIVQPLDTAPMEKSKKDSIAVKSPENTTDDILKKYEILIKKMKELEKKDLLLERNTMILEKNVKQLLLHLEKQELIRRSSRTIKKEKPSEKNIETKIVTSESFGFFQDPFGTKKRRSEFEQQLHILEERKKELETLDAHLINERKQMDKRIAELDTWKEKLFLLESEIERRREVLEEQERTFQKQKEQSVIITSKESTEIHNENHDILETFPQSAAIIQRGLLKQINTPFAQLLGFDPQEIVNKSLFDFIAPEGLTDIEQYYLNRLQGHTPSMFITVFSTKENHKISVEVSIKPAMFNGEKAELVIMDVLEKPAIKNESTTNLKEKPLEESSSVISESPEKILNNNSLSQDKK